MKKNSIFKWLVIMAILGVFVFSACKNEPAVQKKVTITGIPSTYNGGLAVIAISQQSGDDIIAMSSPVRINNSTVGAASLYVGSGMSVPFTGSGTYMVVVLIYDSTLTDVRWTGATFATSITQETTTISFNDFYQSRSVREMPLSVRDALPKVIKELAE